MSGQRVALLVSNGYAPDVRVQKEAHTLALHGYAPVIIAWDREQAYSVHAVEPIIASIRQAVAPESVGKLTVQAGVPITRLQARAGYRTGRRLLRAIPKFWWGAIQELRRARPAIVHAHDLDALLPAWLYARGAHVPVIYDVRDYYPGMVADNVGRPFAGLLERLDHVLTPRVDCVITVGDQLAARYRQLGGRVHVVSNSQPLLPLNRVNDLRATWRAQLGIPEGALLVVYVGYLNPERYLKPLLEAVPVAENVWLVVAGSGPQYGEVERVARECDRAQALGWIPLADVTGVVAAGDIIYHGLKSDHANSPYMVPNLAFFALATGRPMLTLPGGWISQLVDRHGCGLTAKDATPGAVLEALARFRDRAFRQTAGERARKLAEERYHWGEDARRLLAAYHCLGTVKNCS